MLCRDRSFAYREILERLLGMMCLTKFHSAIIHRIK
jgi:hypothetical protein